MTNDQNNVYLREQGQITPVPSGSTVDITVKESGSIVISTERVVKRDEKQGLINEKNTNESLSKF